MYTYVSLKYRVGVNAQLSLETRIFKNYIKKLSERAQITIKVIYLMLINTV